MPSDVLVETGTGQRDRQAGDVNDNLGFLKHFLFVFALIALLVGAFIIFNVFSITVAQRIRELAMLRTIGASRWQLLRSVLAEAFVIGLIASIVGVGVGVLFAKGITQLFDAAGFGLPTTGSDQAAHRHRADHRGHGRHPPCGVHPRRARDADPADRRAPGGLRPAAIALVPLLAVRRRSSSVLDRRARHRAGFGDVGRQPGASG